MRRWTVPIVIALMAVAARIGVQVVAGFYGSPETFEEGEIAATMATGGGYTYELNGAVTLAYRAPAYAFMLAAAYRIFGIAPFVAGVLQALLGGLLVVVMWQLARELGLGHVRSAVAGVLGAAHPGLLVYSAKIHQLNLDAPLFALALLIVIRQERTRSFIEALPVGLVAGTAMLSRVTFAPALAAAALVVWRQSWRTGWRAALGVTVGAGLLVVPWLARNYIEIGEATMSTTSGYILWIGNNPNATGSTILLDGRAMLESDPALRELVWGRDERQQDRIFQDRALSFIRAEPLHAAGLFLQKLFAFWWFGPTVGAEYAPAWKSVYAIYYAVILATAAVGITSSLVGSRRRDLVLAALVALIVLGAEQAVFYVDGRHRWAVEPLMLVFATTIAWRPASDPRASTSARTASAVRSATEALRRNGPPRA